MQRQASNFDARTQALRLWRTARLFPKEKLHRLVRLHIGYVCTDKLEGFVRYGNAQYPWGLACVISNTIASYRRMYVGVKHAGEEWTDILQWRMGTVIIDHRGYGIFPVAAKSVSVWINNKAKGRDDLARPL